ncbi:MULTISPECIES: WhiB family transcriptional regulator [Saccharopolyspora]|uniref:Transcriptional regulator WhiB n=1 Tax=Saccharopolyspora cebuensis TaxID=418759 RepID=A0ABV4CG26_9PSEU
MNKTARLPRPVVDSYQWQLDAACRHEETSRFFHPDNERGSARHNRERRAKEVCFECPVMQQCRAHALNAREPFGVWGGLGELERRDMLAGDRAA